MSKAEYPNIPLNKSNNPDYNDLALMILTQPERLGLRVDRAGLMMLADRVGYPKAHLGRLYDAIVTLWAAGYLIRYPDEIERLSLDVNGTNADQAASTGSPYTPLEMVIDEMGSAQDWSLTFLPHYELTRPILNGDGAKLFRKDTDDEIISVVTAAHEAITTGVFLPPVTELMKQMKPNLQRCCSFKNVCYSCQEEFFLGVIELVDISQIFASIMSESEMKASPENYANAVETLRNFEAVLLLLPDCREPFKLISATNFLEGLKPV